MARCEAGLRSDLMKKRIFESIFDNAPAVDHHDFQNCPAVNGRTNMTLCGPTYPLQRGLYRRRVNRKPGKKTAC